MDYLQNLSNTTERFSPEKFIFFRDGAFDPTNSYFLLALPHLPVSGEYIVQDDVGRPDMISAAIYNNDCQYWWLLLVFNGDRLDGIWDGTVPYKYPIIPNGTVINFFAIDDLERLYFTLRARQLGQIPGNVLF